VRIQPNGSLVTQEAAVAALAQAAKVDAAVAGKAFAAGGTAKSEPVPGR